MGDLFSKYIVWGKLRGTVCGYKTNYKLIKNKFIKTRKERDKESKQLKLNK